MGRAGLKRHLEASLASEPVDAAPNEIARLPGHAVRRQLLRLVCRPEGLRRWRAVTALGRAVDDLADDDFEAAREFVRRLLWGLNEESGTVGFGLPESLGEILAVNERLAAEYLPLFLSYLGPGENFLEFEPLQRGVLWGLGRLVRARPGLIDREDVTRRVAPLLSSPDPEVRGLAVWALGALAPGTALGARQALAGDQAPVSLYDGRRLIQTTVGDLARGASAGSPD